MLLPLLYACQSEEPVKTENPKHKITVKAYLPDSERSRTHITYGNPDVDKEFFRWKKIDTINYNANDYITIFNVSRLLDCPNGLELNAIKVDGNSAVFESTEVVDTSFQVKTGDIIFANYYLTERKVTSDDRNIFTLYVGTESNLPQYIVENPYEDDSYMSYMEGNLKMYDIVTAVKDGEIPDLHFRHLSAIMRVTLRNATGKDLYPTKLEFKYPSDTGQESFFKTTLYCSVDTNPSNKSGLIVYEDDEFYTASSKVYTDTIGTTINGKTGTDDAGESIPDGKSYELYLSTVPRIGNDSYGDELTISLIASHDTKKPYEIRINPFLNPDRTPVIITAGKRYWFDLTAVEEEDGTHKLMLTSEWKEQHPDEKAPGE